VGAATDLRRRSSGGRLRAPRFRLRRVSTVASWPRVASVAPPLPDRQDAPWKRSERPSCSGWKLAGSWSRSTVPAATGASRPPRR